MPTDSLTNLRTTDELRALLQCGIDDANDTDKVMYVEPSWMRNTCQLALDEIERLRQALSDLYDWQNGPPLSTDRWLAEWGNAMKAAERCLGYPTLPPEPETPK